MTLIAPSILSADFANLEQEIKALENAGADMIHIDVMDGHFVPNLTFGPPVIQSLRKHTKLPFDVHLMVNNPENLLEGYAKAGADIITIHPESTTHTDRVIEQIKALDIKAGIALLPTTSQNILEYILDKIDLILVMSVNPGFGGQKFMHTQLEKIQELAKLTKGKDIILQVDGGINQETARLATDKGATSLVSGSYIFKGDYKERIELLRKSK